MAPITFHLVAVEPASTRSSFISALRGLSAADRPLWIGECQHWIHLPHVSVKALMGTGSTVQRWDYLLVTKASGASGLDIPKALGQHVQTRWAIKTDVLDLYLDSFPSKQTSLPTKDGPSLGPGWSADNHDALDKAQPPADLELSLSELSQPFGSDKSGAGIVLQDYVRAFGTSYSGPVAMFNLLSYLPDQRAQYIKYTVAFVEEIGPKYGPEPLFFGDALDWSSKADEGTTAGKDGWGDVGLIWYPSLWNFAKMLDDPMYAELDRNYKQDVLRNNALICCTEVRLD